MLTMSYNSLLFLVFFAALLAVYCLMPGTAARKAVIFAGSMVFYIAAAGAGALAVLFATSLITYFVSVRIAGIYAAYETELSACAEELASLEPPQKLKPKEKTALLAPYKKRAFRYLLAGLILILGVLLYTKLGRVLGFESVTRLRDLRFSKILVPLGISYYTFSAAGYLLDIYWRKAEAERNYFSLILCMTYFPIIVQGPISRCDALMKQFDALPGFSYERVTHGLQLMLWGLYKKMVLADRLTLYPDYVFENLKEFRGPETVLAVLANVIVLYADFSGCMDIVTGASQALGVTLEKNFDHPFFSLSAAEFWRRWHITLSAWFRDYVYMPIATNSHFMKWTRSVKKQRGEKAGKLASSGIPLMIVWLLTGLWHGTGIDYVMWGFYWGALIIIETVFAKELERAGAFLHMGRRPFWHRLFQMCRSFVYFAVGRMITATGSWNSVFRICRHILMRPSVKTLTASFAGAGIKGSDLLVIGISVLLLWAVGLLQERRSLREEIDRMPLPVRWLIYYGAAALVILWGMYGSAYNAADFVYGGF